MQVSNEFKTIIENHLQWVAETDSLFAETLKKPAKNIKDCVNYILTEVKNSGNNGFADEEVFKMARHYYDEDDLKISKEVANVKVVLNHHVELSEADKEEARKTAYNKVIQQEEQRLTKKKPVPNKPTSTDSQPSLF